MIYQNKTDFIKQVNLIGRLIALDVGTKTIGIAVCDENRIICSPVETLRRTKNIDNDINYLINVFKSKNIKGIIVGLPLSFDNQETNTSKYIKSFIDYLITKIDLPIFFQDERLSSFEAEEFLIEKIGTKKTKKVVDSVSASYILEYFLTN